MSTRRWPDTLPVASAPGYGLTPVDQVMRTAMSAGAKRNRRISNADLDLVDFEWRMTDPEFKAFRLWHSDKAVSLAGASDDLSIWTGPTNASRAVGAAISPEGLIVDRILETSATGIHRFNLARASLAIDSAVVLFRATLRGYSRSRGRLSIDDRTGTNIYAEFNLATGAMENTSGLIASTIEDRGNGWYRVTIIANVGVGSFTPILHIAVRDDTGAGTYTGDPAKGLDVAEVQARIATGFDLFVPSDADGKALGAAGGGAWTVMPVATGGGLLRAEARFNGPYQANAGPGLIWTVKGQMEVRNA